MMVGTPGSKQLAGSRVRKQRVDWELDEPMNPQRPSPLMSFVQRGGTS